MSLKRVNKAAVLHLATTFFLVCTQRFKKLDLKRTLERWGYQTIKKLDESSCREYYVAYSSEFKHNVVIRVLIKKDNPEFESEFVARDINLVHLLRHEHIARTLGFHENPQVACIVTEYINDNLFDYLQKNGPLTEEDAKEPFFKLTLAVHYMHNTLKIVHANIRPQSILLDNNLSVKLSDFGKWYPLKTKEYHLDVHGLGSVLYFMLRNDPQYRWYQGNISSPCFHLLTKLFTCSFTTEDILQHDWLQPLGENVDPPPH